MAEETPGGRAPRTSLQESRSFTIVLIGGVMLVVLLACGLTIWNVQTKATSDAAIEKAYNVKIVAHGKEQTLIVRNDGKSIQCDLPVDLKQSMSCDGSLKIAAVHP
jgi:hypothetical protein